MIRIRIQGLKNLVTDPDPDQALRQIRKQAKVIRIRIQAKKDSELGKSLKFGVKNLISMSFCFYYLTIPFLYIIILIRLKQ